MFSDVHCSFYLIFSIIIVLSLNNKQPQAATLPCGDPLEYLITNLIKSDYGSHSQISVFSDNWIGHLESYYFLQNKSYSVFSVSFNGLRNISFVQDFYSNKNNSSVQSIAMLIPNDLKSAVDIFSEISLTEKLTIMYPGNKPQIFIVLPDECKSMNCFFNEIVNSPVQLPPISTETYILQCTMTEPEGFWNLSSAYSVGYKHLLQTRSIEFHDIYNPFAVRWNFSNAKLRTSVPVGVLKEEFNYVQKNGDVQLFRGLGANVISYLEDALNFKMEYMVTEDWIKKSDEMSYTERARQQLENDTLQIATIAKTTFLPIRKESFGFLVPHFVEGVQAFFCQPPASSMRNIFKEPFRLDLWGTIVVVWCLVGFSAILAAKIKSGYEQLDDADREISKDSLLWAIAFTCQQGWHIDPESISIKIIFLCGSIMGLIVYVAYSAALVSALSSVVIPVKSFDDLLYSDFTFAFEPDSQTIEAILSDSQYGDDEISGAEVSIIRKKTLHINDANKGVGLVFTSNVAYLSFGDFFYSVAKNKLNKSDLTLCSQIFTVGVSKVPFRSGMAVRKMSPYKDFLNIRLVWMYENGLMRRYQTNYKLEFIGSCDKQRHKTDLGLGLNDVFTAYVIILSGYALSFTIFLIEKLHFKKYKISHENQMNEGQLDVF